MRGELAPLTPLTLCAQTTWRDPCPRRCSQNRVGRVSLATTYLCLAEHGRKSHKSTWSLLRLVSGVGCGLAPLAPPIPPGLCSSSNVFCGFPRVPLRPLPSVCVDCPFVLPNVCSVRQVHQPAQGRRGPDPVRPGGSAHQPPAVQLVRGRESPAVQGEAQGTLASLPLIPL